MTNPFLEKPILNLPYRVPPRYWAKEVEAEFNKMIGGVTRTASAEAIS